MHHGRLQVQSRHTVAATHLETRRVAMLLRPCPGTLWTLKLRICQVRGASFSEQRRGVVHLGSRYCVPMT